ASIRRCPSAAWGKPRRWCRQSDISVGLAYTLQFGLPGLHEVGVDAATYLLGDDLRLLDETLALLVAQGVDLHAAVLQLTQFFLVGLARQLALLATGLL